MCGIAGYIGHQSAHSILLDALQRVEYRGYDSCGIAIQTGEGIRVFKNLGFVDQLRQKVAPVQGFLGIGHTRWATVGKPTVENAHPHLDCTGALAIVHNGDIANYVQIKQRLLEQGHQFRSETDSEVLAHMFEDAEGSGLIHRVASALQEVEGSYALAVLGQDTDQLVMARRESPLVLGLGQGENFIASDVPAVLENTQEIIFLEDGDLGVLHSSDFQVWHGELPQTRRVHQISWSPRDLDKAGYDHFFLKEVHEQPRVIRDTMAGRLSSTQPEVTLDLDLKQYQRPESILLAGCGSAYHACLIGEQFLSSISPYNVSALVASEMQHPRSTEGGSLAILMSQSGETADTISAARMARAAGHFTLALTSNQSSSIARLVEETLDLRTGPEVSVAASKTFMAQIIGLYLLRLHLTLLSINTLHTLLTELRLLPAKIQRVLALEGQLQTIASRIAPQRDVFLIGKGISYPVALEGALKFKELAYIHAEGYPAGELKHGPFALLSQESPVIAIMPQDSTYPRMLNTLKEIKARGAPVIAITDTDAGEVSHLVDELITVPLTEPLFSPVLTVVPLQLLAYYVARERGCPIDRPRNLAKSVTVH